MFARIQTESNNTSPLKRSQRSGVRFPLSKSFSLHGRESVTIQNTPSTKMPLQTAWQSSVNIIHVSTKNLALSLHLVSLSIYSFRIQNLN
jgi:hypothetical protein